MTPEERARYDAKANEEAWDHAISILRPFVEITRQIGTDELMGVMEKALDEAEMELNRALDVLESIESGAAVPNHYRLSDDS